MILSALLLLLQDDPGVPPTGGMITTTNIRPVKLIRYASAFDYFVMACECIFCVFILYYIIEELFEVRE